MKYFDDERIAAEGAMTWLPGAGSNHPSVATIRRSDPLRKGYLMAVEHQPIEEEDFLEPEATLERLTDVLNEVLSIPAEEGLGAVIRAQVERGSAAGGDIVPPAESAAEAEPVSGDSPVRQDDGPSA